MLRRTKSPGHLIRITRHIAGPPRRAPGDILRLTAKQRKKQGLAKGRDFEFLTSSQTGS